MVKNLSAVQETWVWSLGQEEPLEKGMVMHSSILVWRIPWTEEISGLQSMGSQRVRYYWATNTFTLHLSFLFDFPTYHLHLFFTAICKASPVSHFAFLHFFSTGMVLIPVSCTMSRSSRVQLFVTSRTHLAPLSIEFSRQEYWSALPFPSPGDLPNPGIEPGYPELQADYLLSETAGNLFNILNQWFSSLYILRQC